MKKFLDRILPTGGKTKTRHPPKGQSRPSGQKRRVTPDTENPPPSRSSLDIPDLTGMNEQQRRDVLINHALKVKRARVALVQNLDDRSQKVLRLMATAMASKMDKTVDDKMQERLKNQQKQDQDAVKHGQDLHAAMQAARKILDQD